MIDSFSIPFFTAAALGVLALLVAMRWLRESLPPEPLHLNRDADRDGRIVGQNLRPLLGAVFIGQFALATFEATFALYAQSKFGYGPAKIGAAFVVCGAMMAIFQVVAVGLLSGALKENYQIAAGFAVMGMSLAMFARVRATPFIFTLVALFAFGVTLISPNLAALISERGGSHSAGKSLGAQNATSSLAQAAGPLLGSVLFVWHVNAPYLLAGALSLTGALIVLLGDKQALRSSGPRRREVAN